MPIGSSDLRRLVGRAEEVELLASLLDGARNAGSALVIKGEPEVGKSRLLSEAAGAGARAEVLGSYHDRRAVNRRSTDAERRRFEAGTNTHIDG
jgi:predicted ATP-dependent serine protease